ncbi:hypothetical protein [Streptomyces sp. NRRL S-378]|uniref:hypothetical protein n=1 Tax=Streptomyces sp. NRRL S-378 TaxID=1463904 RepID=UPI000691FC20|nr:hypothetical protein [Streptomyces sp. NRRL S-378]
MQFTGTAQLVEPTATELELFGPGPHFVNGEVFEPVYLGIEPQFITVRTLSGSGNGNGDGSGHGSGKGERKGIPDRLSQHAR